MSTDPKNSTIHTPVGKPHKKPDPPTSAPQSSGIKIPKRPALSEAPNPTVFKRKAAPANLFITSNKKPKVVNEGKNEVKPGEKKESVRERLARQMVFLVEVVG